MSMGEPRICQCGGLMPGVSSLPGAAYNEGFLAGVRAATKAIPGAVSAPNPTDSVARDEVTVSREALSDVLGWIENGEDFDHRDSVDVLRAALSEGEESK